MSASPVQAHLAGEVVKAAEDLLLRLEAGCIDGELYKLMEALKERDMAVVEKLRSILHHLTWDEREQAGLKVNALIKEFSDG